MYVEYDLTQEYLVLETQIDFFYKKVLAVI